jgi:hypothetical protein
MNMNDDRRSSSSIIFSYQEMLAAEFNYIAQTAFQANEDRARSAQFFLISFATFLAAIFSSQVEGVATPVIYTVFAVVFVLLTIFGAATILELARLRQAWLESVRAMNAIKAALIAEAPGLEASFRWNISNLPAAYKPWSVGFLIVVQVACVAGAAAGAAVAFGGLATGLQEVPWGRSLLTTAITGAGLIYFCYYLPLKGSGA